MEKPWDREISKMSLKQLKVLKYWLGKSEAIFTNREIAKKTGVVEKELGGVMSALSRKRVKGMALIVPMGREGRVGLRWKLNSKAITIALAEQQVSLIIKNFKS